LLSVIPSDSSALYGPSHEWSSELLDLRRVSSNLFLFSPHCELSFYLAVLRSTDAEHITFYRVVERAIYIPQVSLLGPNQGPELILTFCTAEPIFIGGNVVLGAFCLGIGFIRRKIPFFILRALAGIGEHHLLPIPRSDVLNVVAFLGASCTIPAALSMIIRLFPEPKAQAGAIAVFGATGAVANSSFLCLFILCFHEYSYTASSCWITPRCRIHPVRELALDILVRCNCHACYRHLLHILHPQYAAAREKIFPRSHRRLNFDQSVLFAWVPLLVSNTIFLPKVSILLFVFALTQGANTGWGHGGVIAPLVISVVLCVAFFLWERRMPAQDAAL
jgi:hypothetical protein